MLRISAALILIILLSLAGCAQPPATTTAPPTATTTATAPPTATATATPSQATGPYGELRMAISTFGGESFDPIITSASDTESWEYPMFDFLTHSQGSELAPGIAEKWEVAADGLSWTFKIRQSVKFHNGEDLKADDVKFSLERYMSKDALYRYISDMVERLEIVDDYTLKAYTKGTQPYLAIQCGLLFSPSQGAIMPKDYIEQNGMTFFKTHPVGSGPFKFIRNVPGDMVEYEAIAKHWRASPDFKKLTMILIPEETTRVAALKSGQVDAIDVGLEAAEELDKAGFETPSLDFNSAMVPLHGAYTTKGVTLPTGDIRVRKALSLAINREEIAKSFFYGKSVVPMPPFLAESSSDVDIAYWKDYAVKNLNIYDPDKAASLIKEAGYPNGFTIKLWTCTISGAPYLPKLAEVVQGYWTKVGVKTEIVPTDWGTYRGLRKAAELIGQASTYRYGPTPMTPKDLNVGYHSAGTFALLAKTIPELDKLIDGAYTETNDTKRKEMLASVIQQGTDTYTIINIASVPVVAALGPRIQIDFPIPTRAVGLGADIARHRK